MQIWSGICLFSPPELHPVLSVGDSKHAGEGDKGFVCKAGLLNSVLGFELVCDFGQLVFLFSVTGTVSWFGQGPPLRAWEWLVRLEDAACDGQWKEYESFYLHFSDQGRYIWTVANQATGCSLIPGYRRYIVLGSPSLPCATLKRMPDARPKIRSLHLRLLLLPNLLFFHIVFGDWRSVTQGIAEICSIALQNSQYLE